MSFHGKRDYYTDWFLGLSGLGFYDKEIIDRDGNYWDEILDEWIELPNWLEYCIVPERIIYVKKCCLVLL